MVRVGFAGDLNLALKVGMALEHRSDAGAADVHPDFPFEHVVDRLRAADLMVGNLECVASTKGLLATEHNPFRCPLAIGVLQAAGFDLVSVANNHAKDFGQRGFDAMLGNLDAAGLPHFGKETFTRKRQAPYVKVIDGIRIGLLAYYWPPKDELPDVHAARPAVDVLMVFMHWGREDQPEPLLMQVQLAKKLIDAGVDVVVGTHAHVMQPTAWYRGKFIAYGIGNFVFSGMTHTELHRTGALLEVDLDASGVVAHRVIGVRLGEDGAPRFVADPDTVEAQRSPP